jgi:hypothetical protein
VPGKEIFPDLTLELLDSKRQLLFFDIDIQYDGLDFVPHFKLF